MTVIVQTADQYVFLGKPQKVSPFYFSERMF